MVIVKIEGGLANRMFQYALFLSLRNRRNDVYLDEKTFKPAWSFEKISLKKTFPHLDCSERDLSNFKVETRPGKVAHAIRNIVERISNKYFFQKEFRFYPEILDNLPKDIYLRGYWQSEKYFKDVEEEVRKAFTFDAFTEKENIKAAEKMRNENSVAIHIRKGKDYMQQVLTAGTCPKEYYVKAIDHIRTHVDAPKFYIFTDNPDWVKENLGFIDYTLVNWNPVSGDKNYRDIQLMSCCKHNIIANSSFSWWGAWLNSNPNKIVIGPKVWFNPEGKIKVVGDIICESWVSM